MVRKSKIKDLIILNDSKKLIDEKYVYIIFSDGKEDAMLFDEAIKYLKKYSISNRFKKAEDLLSSFNITYKDFEDFLQVNGYKDKKEWLAESRDTIIERYRGGVIKSAKRDIHVNYEDKDVTSVAKKGR